MDLNLLDALTIEDLSGEDRDLADTIDMEAFIKLIKRYRGTGRMYIKKADELLRPMRDVLIRREFNGYNFCELAHKWDLTDRYIREIVKNDVQKKRNTPSDAQLSFQDIS